MMHRGMMINIANYLEDISKDWARQLAIYAWLLDCPIGSDFLVAIDQLCCSPSGPGQRPTIRVAEHRTRVSPNFQHATFNRAVEIWEIVHSDHLFRDRSKTASQALAASLDRRSRELCGEGSDEDQFFAQITRTQI